MKKPRSESRRMQKAVTIRMSDDLMHVVNHAAKLSNMTPSSWARVALSEASGLRTERVPKRKPRKKPKPLGIADDALKIADAAISLSVLHAKVEEFKGRLDLMHKDNLVNAKQVRILMEPHLGVLLLVADINTLLFSVDEGTNDT